MKEILHYLHLWHRAHESIHHSHNQGASKLTALALIVIGFFLAPILVGIPMMIYGFFKLFSD